MLAPKSYPAPLGSSGSAHVGNNSSSNMPPTRRAHAMPSSGQGFNSPTESEFSDLDGPDAVKNWNEDQVADYLRSVKCGEYEKLFRKNHINGENLLELDKDVLKEMGIEKVGDRVRLFLGIKKLRTRAYANVKKRNRVSLPPSRCVHLVLAPSAVRDGLASISSDTCVLRTRLADWQTLNTPPPPGLPDRPPLPVAEQCRPRLQTRDTPDRWISQALTVV